MDSPPHLSAPCPRVLQHPKDVSIETEQAFGLDGGFQHEGSINKIVTVRISGRVQGRRRAHSSSLMPRALYLPRRRLETRVMSVHGKKATRRDKTGTATKGSPPTEALPSGSRDPSREESTGLTAAWRPEPVRCTGRSARRSAGIGRQVHRGEALRTRE